jgi:hypothetical protein
MWLRSLADMASSVDASARNGNSGFPALALRNGITGNLKADSVQCNIFKTQLSPFRL